MQHYSHFNKFIANPIKRYGFIGQGYRALMTLKTDVLDKAMLRRTKEERKADMEIPSLEMQTVLLNLEEPEQVCSWETSS